MRRARTRPATGDAGVVARSGGTAILVATSTTLAADTAGALQQALAAENAAIWTCGLVSAFVSSAVASEIQAATVAHQARRDAVERELTDGGVTPQPAQPAYQPPQPVTGQSSGLTVLALAEAAVAVAWRAVLEQTDDANLRRSGMAALADAAVRQTRWRRLAGISPASVAMPGQPPG